MKRGKQSIICNIIGIWIFIFIAMILTALLSRYTSAKYISERMLEWSINGILFLASAITNLVITKIIKDNILSASILNVSVIMAIPFAAGSAIDGPFHNTIFRLGAILGGTIAMYLITQAKQGKRNTHKRRYR